MYFLLLLFSFFSWWINSQLSCSWLPRQVARSTSRVALMAFYHILWLVKLVVFICKAVPVGMVWGNDFEQDLLHIIAGNKKLHAIHQKLHAFVVKFVCIFLPLSIKTVDNGLYIAIQYLLYPIFQCKCSWLLYQYNLP